MNFLFLTVLLALPTAAVMRLGSGYYWIGIYMSALSGITYLAYRADKRSAQEGTWRVPEARLHFFEVLGGWPGAFIAQRRLRHKSSKASFLFVFWLIVLAWQFAAFDSFHNWKFTNAILDHFGRQHHRQS